MAVEPAVGDGANLLFGYRPWSASDSSPAFFAPAEAPAARPDPELIDEDDKWEGPVVTVHPDAASLVSAVYGYQVELGAAEKGEVPAGPLVLQDSDAAASAETLGEYLGVTLGPGLGYLLVRHQRTSGRRKHPLVTAEMSAKASEYLTPGALGAASALPLLPPGETPTLEQAQKYLDFFETYGTHFVSEITYGEVIYQAFSYEREYFDTSVKKLFDRLADDRAQVTGKKSLDFRAMTTEPFGERGGVKEYGKILAYSRDPELAATVAAGRWRDKAFAGDHDSIFAPNLQGDFDLIDDCSQVVPISLTFHGLPDLFPERNLVLTADRLLRGGLLHKYAPGVQLSVSRKRPDWATYYPKSSGSWLSTLATPTVDVYQERTDLSAVKIGRPADVENFRVTTHVLQVSSAEPTPVPGTSVQLLAHVLDTSEHAGLPELRLTKQALESLTLHCGNMFGALRLAAEDPSAAHYTLLDGLRFADSDTVEPSTKRPWVKADASVTGTPPDGLVSSAANSLQFSLVTAEAMLAPQGPGSEGVRALGRRFLEWLARIIPERTTDAGLSVLRARALFLARMDGVLEDAATEVPYLTYKAYQPLVGALLEKAKLVRGDLHRLQERIEQRKQTELLAENQEEINQSIKETGRVLVGYLRALQEHQGDVAAQHQLIVKRRQDEYAKAITDVDALRRAVNQELQKVNSEVAKFKQNVQDWESDQWLAFGISAAQTIFAIGASFVVPTNAPDAVKKFANTVEMLQKLAEVIQKLAEIAGNLFDTVANVTRMQDALGKVDGKLELPAPHEWAELEINFRNTLLPAGCTDELKVLADPLVVAFGALARRGKAWVEAGARMTQLRQEADAAVVAAGLNAKQKERLERLDLKLNSGNTRAPEVDHIDLIGLTGEAEFQLKQTLSALARVLVQQDGAVQYEYLGLPSRPASFDIAGLIQVIADQQTAIIDGIHLLQPRPQKVPEPITYRVEGVPVKALLDGDFTFTIPSDAREFENYAMVRVDKVIARVKGVKSAEGTYALTLVYGGSPFHDRNKAKHVLTFRTIERRFGPYEYDRETGKLKFGGEDGPFDKKITRVTPFSTWKVGVPTRLAPNKGVEFTGPTTDVELDFHITAQYPDEAQALGTRYTPMSSENELVQDMYDNGSPLRGWDAVLNMDFVKVNSILRSLHEKDNPGGTVRVTYAGWTDEISRHNGIYYASSKDVDITLGKPRLELLNGQEKQVKIVQYVESGRTRQGSLRVPKGTKSKDLDYEARKEEIDWDDWETLNIAKGESAPLVNSTIPLAVVEGTVKPHDPKAETRAVALEWSSGKFEAKYVHGKNMEILDKALTEVLTRKGIVYRINTIDFSQITPIPELTPTRFLARTRTTNSGREILQLFITTDGKPPNDDAVLVSEPLPTGHDVSLMINTRIMFQGLLAGRLRGDGLTATAIDPGNAKESWKAQLWGSVNATVKWPDTAERGLDGTWYYTTFRFDKNNKDQIAIPLDGLIFERSQTGQLTIKLTLKKKVDFEWLQSGGSLILPPLPGSVDFELTIEGAYNVTVNRDAGKQAIVIENPDATPTITTESLSRKGPCEGGLTWQKEDLAEEMKRVFPGTVKKAIEGISFEQASVFALQNLLFPAGNRMDLSEAYVPGDLLILGSLTTGS
ncbi:MAC/perforin domain-containing protein [Streptomyces koyangensis]